MMGHYADSGSLCNGVLREHGSLQFSLCVPAAVSLTLPRSKAQGPVPFLDWPMKTCSSLNPISSPLAIFACRSPNFRTCWVRLCACLIPSSEMPSLHGGVQGGMSLPGRSRRLSADGPVACERQNPVSVETKRSLLSSSQACASVGLGQSAYFVRDKEAQYQDSSRGCAGLIVTEM